MYELFVGKTNRNNVQAVYSGGKLASFSTVVIGCGLFSDLIYHTERQRWLKKARYIGEIKFTNCDFVTETATLHSSYSNMILVRRYSIL